MAFVFIAGTTALDGVKEKCAYFYYRIFKSKIFKAIENGNDVQVLELATKQRLLSSRGLNGESPLVACILAGKSELACNLISRGGFFSGDGALIMATICGDQLVVDKLLENNVDPNDTSGNTEYHQGHTPLMWATNRHYFGIMEALLNAGADVNMLAQDKTTAAMYTRNAADDDLRALKILLKYKPDINIRDWRGRNLIQEAQDRKNFGGKPQMLELLIQHYPEIVENDA